MGPIKSILHPTDFSEHSAFALELACGLARDHDARLILLHVLPRALCDAGAFPEAERYHRDLESYREEMRGRLVELPLPGLPVHAERIVREGDPATAILDTARATCCDLIVMGTHGRSGELRWLMGSVAEEVTQKAACSVVTVKAPLARSTTAAEPAEEVGVIL